MTDISNFKRLSLAAAIVVSAFGSISVPSSAFANGTHPTGDGGAVCKGAGHCLVLQLDCKGTYTDAIDPAAPSMANAARPRRSARRTSSSSRADRLVFNENGGRQRRHFLVSTCRSRSRSRRFLLAAEEQACDEPDHNQPDSSRCRRVIAGCLFYHPAMPPDRRQSLTEALGKIRIVVRGGVTAVLVIGAAAPGHGFSQRRQFPGEGCDLLFKVDVGEGRK